MSTQNKPMSKFEWLTRCQMQFAKSTLAFDYDWSVIAESCYDEMSEDFESDPEGCAREEMSCWN